MFIVEYVALQRDSPPAGIAVENLFGAVEPADVNRRLQSASNYAAQDRVAAVLHVPDLVAH